MSKQSRNEEGEHENSERWLLTYSDMITLLLALFIMMYTMSTLDSSKYKALSEQLGAVFDPGHAAVTAPSVDSGIKFTDSPNFDPVANGSSNESPSPSPSATKAGDYTKDNIASRLQVLIDNAGLKGFAVVHTEERGVVVSLMDALLFPSGSATINEDAKDLLKKITGVINSVDNYIRVEGSTDDVPINSGQFPSNWELAAQRATNVVKALINYGVKPSRISVTSYGEYRPVAKNDTEENKKLNRRVDIVVVSTILNAYELGNEK